MQPRGRHARAGQSAAAAVLDRPATWSIRKTRLGRTENRTKHVRRHRQTYRQPCLRLCRELRCQPNPAVNLHLNLNLDLNLDLTLDRSFFATSFRKLNPSVFGSMLASKLRSLYAQMRPALPVRKLRGRHRRGRDGNRG
jgi:hypothetical protein